MVPGDPVLDVISTIDVFYPELIAVHAIYELDKHNAEQCPVCKIHSEAIAPQPCEYLVGKYRFERGGKPNAYGNKVPCDRGPAFGQIRIGRK